MKIKTPLSPKTAIWAFIGLAFLLSNGAGVALMFASSWVDEPFNNYIIKIGVTFVAIAGILIAKKQNASTQLIGQCLPKKRHTKYYSVILIYFLVCTLLIKFFDIEPLDFFAHLTARWAFFTVDFFLMFLLVGFGEEIGWRGVLLPNLLKVFTPVKATLIVSVVWFVWHTPKLLYWINHSNPLYVVILFVTSVALSFIFTWIYLKFNGDIFFIAALHALHNLSVYWAYDFLISKQVPYKTADWYWISNTGIVVLPAMAVLLDQKIWKRTHATIIKDQALS